jgi:hypothetical protein
VKSIVKKYQGIASDEVQQRKNQEILERKELERLEQAKPHILHQILTKCLEQANGRLSGKYFAFFAVLLLVVILLVIMSCNRSKKPSPPKNWYDSNDAKFASYGSCDHSNV